MASPEIPDGEEIPEGMRPDARETWPSRELIESFLGDFDFELRPGETIHVDTEEQARAARTFREVLGRFASGITVVTATATGEPVGMTCQSFMSVSLDPPLVLFSPAKTSRAWPRIQRAGKFCVNFLGADQEALSNTMASRGTDKFADIVWAPSAATGSPLIDGILGYVDCTIHAVHEAGDHYVVLGRVQDLQVGVDGEPLLFYRGEYRTTGE
ncbi:MAG: flavin reductase family protein [Nocardioides sp.]